MDDEDDDMPLGAFLYSTWLEEDADGINMVILTPEREAQRARIAAHLVGVAPSGFGPGGAHYPLTVLELAWKKCRWVQ